MTNVMVDIETLATRNDAAIIQIGACCFDETGILHDPLLVSVEREFYDNNNVFFVDPKTEAWWASQSKAARSSLTINKVTTVYLALDRMIEWFGEVGFEKSGDRGAGLVWANPPQFDLSILRFAASKAYGSDNDVPWHYRQERDMRTLGTLAGRVSYEELGAEAEGLIAHRADHDAIRQALIVNRQLKRLMA